MAVKKMNAAVVHHFFAHYRDAVLRHLMDSPSIHYMFVADKADVTGSGIHPSSIVDTSRFVYAPCLRVAGPLILQRGLLRLALSRQYDAIIYLGDAHFLSTWFSVIVARLTGKRVLFWTHGWLRKEDGLKSWTRRAFYRMGHGLLLYGERARRIGMGKGFKSRDLYVIYNSLDVEKQEEIRRQVSVDHIREIRKQLFGHWDKPMVVCSTRLVGSKQIDLLLEAASVLKNQNHPIDILIIGDGPEKARLEAMTSELNISVVFYGPCYEEERTARLLMSANATVVPGAIGLTVMHSLIYGTPVITHDDAEQQGPEWEAIEPGINGQLFKKGDRLELAKAIQLWTRTSLPNETIREQCYKSIERRYRASYQVRVIEAAVMGISADKIPCPERSN